MIVTTIAIAAATFGGGVFAGSQGWHALALDYALRVIPGSRLNPSSLESRVRSAIGLTDSMFDKAAAVESSIADAVEGDAKRGIAVSQRKVVHHQGRQKAFQALVDDNISSID